MSRLEELERNKCACKDENPDVQDRVKELDELEHNLEMAEQQNKEKTMELIKVSNQVQQLQQQMQEINKQMPASKEQQQEIDQNQKILETYSQTWNLTNQVFMQMYG
jgi:predicted  nucleic acid-binding Zn-ribbon protein